MKARYIDANALINYANNQIDKTISANDIARFPTAIDIKWHYPSKGEYPVGTGDLLVYTDDGFFDAIDYSDEDDGGYSSLFGDYNEEQIIAWQYLPEPPKGAEYV